MSDILPEGKYPARAVDWKLGQTSNLTEQACVEFKFVDASLGSIMWFGFFTEKTYERTVESLRHCGWTGQDVLELDTPQANLNTNEVELVIGHETYEGVTRAKVKWVNKKGGVALVTPLAADKRAQFQARMKASIAAMELGKPKAPPSPPKPNGKPEDLPF